MDVIGPVPHSWCKFNKAKGHDDTLSLHVFDRRNESKQVKEEQK